MALVPTLVENSLCSRFLNMNSRFLRGFVLCELTVALSAGCGGGSGKHAIEVGDAAGPVGAAPGTDGAAAAGGAAAVGGFSNVAGTLNSGGSPSTGGAAVGGATTSSGGGLPTGGNVPTGGYATSSGSGGATGGLASTGGATATGGNFSTGGVPGSGGASVGGSSATGGNFSTGGVPGSAGVGVGGLSATGGNPPTGGNSSTGGEPGSGGASVGGSSATGGSPPTGGSSSSGGASASGGAGAGGLSATGGTAGIGSSSTVAACGGVTLSGKITFDGHSAITFDSVMPTLHHKRDVDPSEDACLNSIVLIFSIGGACKLEVDVDSSNTCLAHSVSFQGLHISGMRFEADSQCPGIPDAEEGIYSATATSLNGATVFMSSLIIGEANVASSCVTETFNLTLAGGLRNTTTGGVLHFSRAGISQLTVTGKFLSTEGPGACPTTPCPGCGSYGRPPCDPGEFCDSLGVCAYPGTSTSCTDFGQCSGTSDCLSTPAGFRCWTACTSDSECILGPSPARQVCFAASNGDKTCQLDCSAAGSKCPTATVCQSYAAGKFCF